MTESRNKFYLKKQIIDKWLDHKKKKDICNKDTKDYMQHKIQTVKMNYPNESTNPITYTNLDNTHVLGEYEPFDHSS